MLFVNSSVQTDKQTPPVIKETPILQQSGIHTMFESRRRLFFRYFGVFLLLMVFLYTLSRLTWPPSKPFARYTTTSPEKSVKADKSDSSKLVLLWNWTGDNNTTTVMDLSSWSLEKDTLPECPSKCNFVMNISNISFPDAIVFNANVMDEDYVVPSRDYSHQIWTIFRTESPVSLTVTSDFFYFYDNINWTMTYRQDSDVHWPAGQLVPTRNLVHNATFPSIESLKSKSLIAWLNSDCKTSNRRELYVRNLTKFIPIDNYGVCKPQKTLCNRNTTNCHEKLAKKYKFWLVYESAFCVDYLTEEYYSALEYGMVPILFAHERAVELALSGTFINGRDFKNPEDLAKYLRHLDANPQEYLKYFEWRRKFQVVGKKKLSKKTWCNFCTKLHRVDPKQAEGEQKFYNNLDHWFKNNFTNQRQCQIPVFTKSSDLFFSLFKFQ